jgi:DNA methylase N-4/N-6 domain protein
MSRLTDLLRQARVTDPQLGAAIEDEVTALLKRRTFGLVFERHQPEAVELPNQCPRRGSKVRVLPPRGETKNGDQRLWRVTKVVAGTADLEELNAEKPERRQADLNDLIVVAEFQDTIYPGLVETGRVERGGNKPCHTIINGENFHALEMLTYTHRHKIDAIYIDPPYNTGARDWKYNNDYVESDDDYRHSKWLSFMEKRLLLARELLNPADSVLIVTIDEKEYLRLGLLLEQIFPEGAMEMVTSVISAKGVARFGQFSRVEEYIYTVRFGVQEVGFSESNMLDDSRSASAQVGEPISWLGLRRREPTARRGARPRQFYPIYVDEGTGYIHSVGEYITDEVDRRTVPHPIGTFAVWPLLPDGTEGLWGITPETAKRYLSEGYLRARNFKPARKYVAVQYLPSGTVSAIESGEAEIIGRDEDGAVLAEYKSAKGVIPKRVWNMPSHNAETGGTKLLSALLGRRFPFPKSLYAVEDTLRFFVKDKPEAIILDFFAGSGTTAHAVMRLNKQDGGRRQCISVTNNEVSADEQVKLRKRGLRPADSEWEDLGICDYITKPRIQAAITGRNPEGEPIKGDYKFTDEFPLADGFEENARFFTLTYESPLAVKHNRAFQKIAPMLWLRAGASGRIIDSLGERGWNVAEAYGILQDLSHTDDFLSALSSQPNISTVFVVTDDDAAYQMVARELPDSVDVVRLYESYLQNFEINQGVML